MKLTQYHAVMSDETGCEFGYTFEAFNKAQAYEYLREQFPESHCVQLEDEYDTQKRLNEIYERLAEEYDDGYYYADEYY